MREWGWELSESRRMRGRRDETGERDEMGMRQRGDGGDEGDERLCERRGG